MSTPTPDSLELTAAAMRAHAQKKPVQFQSQSDLRWFQGSPTIPNDWLTCNWRPAPEPRTRDLCLADVSKGGVVFIEPNHGYVHWPVGADQSAIWFSGKFPNTNIISFSYTTLRNQGWRWAIGTAEPTACEIVEP